MSAKYSFSRFLPVFFQKIPTFAHRIYFDYQNLIPSGGRTTWSSDGCETFRKYVQSWETEMPIYYSWRPSSSNIIKLDDLNQELAFNPETQQWEAGLMNPHPVNENLNLMKDDPLIASLYTAIGVEIMYEILVKKDTRFHFELLTGLLVDNGFATTRAKNKIKPPSDLHEGVVRAMTNMTIVRAQMDVNKTGNMDRMVDEDGDESK
jgi:hypothetical protein